ncbi:hypothetical protein ABZ953_38835 [Streptomyces sp. NPDC046465]|uniref:hypothetical protein n=1 Tax=Streptomyces sp. NPDC046465 TaxID=3155810 RepID=UPI0033F4E453
MPLTPPPHGAVRSSSELNERIRDLWLRTGSRLSTDQRREYAQLVTEWAAAVREEMVKAA